MALIGIVAALCYSYIIMQKHDEYKMLKRLHARRARAAREILERNRAENRVAEASSVGLGHLGSEVAEAEAVAIVASIESLAEKYDRAARYPWLWVAPDPSHSKKRPSVPMGPVGCPAAVVNRPHVSRENGVKFVPSSK